MNTGLLWTPQVVLAAELVVADATKVTGDPAEVGMFDTIGAGQWPRYMVGALEMPGAVGSAATPDPGAPPPQLPECVGYDAPVSPGA